MGGNTHSPISMLIFFNMPAILLVNHQYPPYSVSQIWDVRTHISVLNKLSIGSAPYKNCWYPFHKSLPCEDPHDPFQDLPHLLKYPIDRQPGIIFLSSITLKTSKTPAIYTPPTPPDHDRLIAGPTFHLLHNVLIIPI